MPYMPIITSCVADPRHVDDAEEDQEVQPKRQQRKQAAEEDAVDYGLEQEDVEEFEHGVTPHLCAAATVPPSASSRASEQSSSAFAAYCAVPQVSRLRRLLSALTAWSHPHICLLDRVALQHRARRARRSGCSRPRADTRGRPRAAPAARSARRSARSARTPGGGSCSPVEHLLHHHRRKACARLVEQQQLRIGHHGPADRAHLLLAAGHGAGKLVVRLHAGTGRTRPQAVRRSDAPRASGMNAPIFRLSCTVRRGTAAGSPARARCRG